MNSTERIALIAIAVLTVGLVWLAPADSEAGPTAAPLAAEKYRHMPAVATTVAKPSDVAIVDTPALRRRPSIQVTPTDPPPTTTTVPTGINGLPFAPDHLTGCDRMEWYADQAGLPEQFHWIGYEESRCDNAASSWCCHGYFQIHEGWVKWAATEARTRCDVTHASQFDARTPIARQRNACMAKLVFDAQGFCAWDVVPWC